MIATRAARRWGNLAGVGAVVALMGYAVFAQQVQGYEACPLCIFQRIGMIAVGLVLLVAALHAPVSRFARVYAILGALTAAGGASISARHIYIQHLPADAVPSCGPPLNFMWDTFGPLETIKKVLFTGSGECADVNWVFMGLSMPTWVLIWFAILGTLAVVVNWGRVAR